MTRSSKSAAQGPAPEFSILRAGGRMLRVAVWKARPPAGQTPATPLLFFNGIGANIEVMSPLADWFPDRDLITFDMPGIGGSPNPVAPYRPWTMAWTASRLLKQLGYDKVDVMGVSWGGGLAQQFAFQCPKQTGRLVLAATSAGVIMAPGDIRALSKMADPKRYVDPEFMRKNFEALYGGETKGSDGHIGRIRAPSRTGYLYQLGAMVGWTSVPFLPFLKAPTLVMMGDADRIVPLVNGKFLTALIPGARLEVIKDGGHLFLVSKAEIAAPIIRDFLDEGRVKVSRRKAA
ncbi:MAG: alpha/beta fold hydrolase [Caulobacter sp.]|nr:alpha/beta fold hydrolase [Caulobacter sp.]